MLACLHLYTHTAFGKKQNQDETQCMGLIILAIGMKRLVERL